MIGSSKGQEQKQQQQRQSLWIVLHAVQLVMASGSTLESIRTACSSCSAAAHHQAASAQGWTSAVNSFASMPCTTCEWQMRMHGLAAEGPQLAWFLGVDVLLGLLFGASEASHTCSSSSNMF
jgi:hypothetical protein